MIRGLIYFWKRKSIKAESIVPMCRKFVNVIKEERHGRDRKRWCNEDKERNGYLNSLLVSFRALGECVKWILSIQERQKFTKDKMGYIILYSLYRWMS